MELIKVWLVYRGRASAVALPDGRFARNGEPVEVTYAMAVRLQGYDERQGVRRWFSPDEVE